jgi:orotate phosphoribosyltransferase
MGVISPYEMNNGLTYTKSYLQTKQEVLEILKENCFVQSDANIFVLASRKISNYYFNLRHILLDPTLNRTISKLMWLMISDRIKVDIDAIGGMELSAVPLSLGISLLSMTNAFIIRKKPKDHGISERLLGMVKPGCSVVIVDDVITTGGSLIESIKVCQEFGLKVLGCAAIVNRSEIDIERLLYDYTDLGYFESLFSLRNFLT